MSEAEELRQNRWELSDRQTCTMVSHGGGALMLHGCSSAASRLKDWNSCRKQDCIIMQIKPGGQSEFCLTCGSGGEALFSRNPMTWMLISHLFSSTCWKHHTHTHILVSLWGLVGKMYDPALTLTLTIPNPNPTVTPILKPSINPQTDLWGCEDQKAFTSPSLKMSSLC